MVVTQISVFLENKAGQLAEITKEINAAGVNIMAISIAEASEYGLARLITADNDKVANVLNEKGYAAKLCKVESVRVEDRPGSLNEILQVLADAGRDIQYMYSVRGLQKGTAYMVIKTEDAEKLEKALKARGIY